MELINANSIPLESRRIASMVRETISCIDPTARVILFGSRARGDAEEESDWDFLVLTNFIDSESLADTLRKRLLREVELKYDVVISLIVKNIVRWESDYSVTNIYESIEEEGIEI